MSGCGTATIHTRERVLDGKVERSDGDAVCVALSSNERVLIERQRITDIEHPGKFAMIAGAVLVAAGIGITAAAASWSRRDDVGGQVGIIGGLGISAAALGLSTGVIGLGQYARSTSATRSSTSAHPCDSSSEDPPSR